MLFYYSLTTASSKYVAYVDADCLFYSDISNFYSELGTGSVLIFRHNFSKDRESWKYKSGDFNVGLILAKRNRQSKECIKVWKNQVLSECVVDPYLGKCGDQTYLNDWPTKYPYVRVCLKPSLSLGPWNLNNFEELDFKTWKIDGEPVMFFHYHGFKYFLLRKFMMLYLGSPGYRIKVKNSKNLFTHYAKRIFINSSDLMSESKNLNFRDFFQICLRDKTFPKLIIKTRNTNRA